MTTKTLKFEVGFIRPFLQRVGFVLFFAAASFTRLSAQDVPVIVNAGFEAFYDPYLEMGPGSPYLPGWTIEGKGLKVTYEKSGPYEGKQYLSFNPPSAAISQTILTSVGQNYAVTYAVSLLDGGVFEASATAGDGTILSTNDYAVQGSETNGWTLYQLFFAATTTNTTLTFQNVSGVSIGLDDITIAAVVPPPIITQAPSNANVASWSAVTFSASAAADGPMTIQWYYESIAIQGATNSSLTVTADETNVGLYSVTFTDAGGSSSTRCLLNVNNNILINGGFEVPPTPNALYPAAPGRNPLPGWTVLANNVWLAYNPPPPQSGFPAAYQENQFIAFNYGGQGFGGIITQTFQTTLGQSYTVSFAVGGSPTDYGEGKSSLGVTVTSATGSVLSQTNCVPTDGWVLYQLSFIATTTNTTLTFTDESPDFYTATLALDAVAVKPLNPPLSLSCGPNGFLFSWPATTQDFHLETSDAIDTNWTAVPVTLVTNFGNVTATVPSSLTNAFFRLRSP